MEATIFMAPRATRHQDTSNRNRGSAWKASTAFELTLEPLMVSSDIRVPMVIQGGAPKKTKLVYNSNNYGL